MKKRGKLKTTGLSTIVGALLLILLVLIAVGAVWFSIKVLITTFSEDIPIEKIGVNMKIKKFSILEGDSVLATIKRNTGGGEVIGVLFVISNDTYSEKIQKNINLNELQTVTYNFNLEEMKPSDVKKLSIIPIFKDGPWNVVDSCNVVNKTCFYNEYILPVEDEEEDDGGTGEELGLIAWYNFDNDMDDYSSHNLNGACSGTSCPVSVLGINGEKYKNDKGGNAYSFDGVDDFITILDNDLLDFEYNESFSISFWAKNSLTSTAEVISKMNYVDEPNRGYVMVLSGFNNKGSTNFALASNLSDNQNTLDVISKDDRVIDNSWHNFVAVYNGAGDKSGVKIYLDGKEINTLIEGERVKVKDTIKNNMNLVIGKMSNKNSGYYKGAIDELKIYNYAISKEEVEDSYKSFLKPLEDKNPIAYYPFDSDMKDYSGNNLNGSCLVTSCPVSVLGVIGNAYSFDGINDRIDLNVSDILNLNKSISMSLWVKGEPQFGTFIDRREPNTYKINYALEVVGSDEEGYGKLMFFYRNFANTNSHQYITNDKVITDNSWHNIILNFNYGDPDSMEIYVDGNLKSGYWFGGVGDEKPYTSNKLITSVGAIQYAGSEVRYNGTIDELKIYN